MGSSKPARNVIDTGIDYKLPVPYVIMGDGISKDDTVFVMADRENSLSILGTFDQIISFASSIIAAMYSWPILAGRDEWLGSPVTPDTESADVYVIYNREQAGTRQDRGNRDEGTGTTGGAA